jgi:leucyl/phenylalanyl-tRNA---protein transferase
MVEPELTPEVLVQAYRTGFFPMAEDREGEIFWFQPELRGVLEFDNLRVSRSLRKVLRSGRYTVTSDTAFRDVMSACADREETWISESIERAYFELFARGLAHSVEVWQEGALVGGLYGVAIGGAFFGESMFHRATDASKVALVHLVHHLRSRGYALLDTQYVNPHLESLGGTEMPRIVYEMRLAAAVDLDVSFGALDPRRVVAQLDADSEAR